MAVLPLNLARVSNTLITNTATQQLTQTQSDLLTTENQLSTGKRINSPSDDPGGAATTMQLQKVLEKRQAYATNLKDANGQLSEVDSTLGSLNDLLTQASTIASANVGSDVTPDARKSAAAVVQNLYDQALTIANSQYNGSYLFAGDKATDAPFAEANGGVQFVGSSNTLNNSVDDNSNFSFQIDGNAVFGAVSSRVQGGANLTPSLTANTRLQDMKGAAGEGISLGSIQLSDGTTSKKIDLSNCDTIDDVVNAINGAAVGTVTASLGTNGLTISSTTSTDNITVDEIGGGKTATDLGVLNTSGAGASLAGAALQPTITPLTTLASLNRGAGISTAGLKIVNGSQSVTVDLTGAVTVEDMLNKINSAGANVRAEINQAGTGINLVNPTQGTSLTIGENGGTTAADLGIRSFSPTSNLKDLNANQGVRTAAGNDIELTDSAGHSFQVDIDGATTVQDAMDKINTAATSAGAGITASFATNGNGIILTDSAGGTGTMSVQSINFSHAAEDLGLTDSPAIGNTITGGDVNAVTADGIFSHLKALQDSLNGDDQAGITKAATGITDDTTRVQTLRGENGAKVQELQSRQSSLDDQNVATNSLLSDTQDTDFTTTIAKFQQLQNALQAGLETTAKSLNLSLMDFLS